MDKELFKSKLQKLVADKASQGAAPEVKSDKSEEKTKALKKIKEFIALTLDDANAELSSTGSTLTIITPEKTQNLNPNQEFIQVFLSKNKNANYAKSPYLLIEPDDENPSRIKIRDRFFQKNDQEVDIANASEELFEQAVLKFISDNL